MQINLQVLQKQGNNVIDHIRSRSMLSLLAQLNRVRRRMQLLSTRLGSEAEAKFTQGNYLFAEGERISEQARMARTLVDKLKASTKVGE